MTGSFASAARVVTAGASTPARMPAKAGARDCAWAIWPGKAAQQGGFADFWLALLQRVEK